MKASFSSFSLKYFGLFSVFPFIAMRDWTGSSSQPRNFETNKQQQQLMTVAGGGGQVAPNSKVMVTETKSRRPLHVLCITNRTGDSHVNNWWAGTVTGEISSTPK